MIRIRDKGRMLEALCEPMRFLDWVHRLRDNEAESTINYFLESTDNWEAFEESQFGEDSLDTSRISINLTPIKRHLNESLLQLSMNGSLFESGEDPQDSAASRRRGDMKACLLQMEIAAKTLDKLCHDESPEISREVTKSLSSITTSLNYLKQTLHFVTSDKKPLKIESIFSKNGLNFTDTPDKTRSPGKRKCPAFQSPGKTVRFNVQ